MSFTILRHALSTLLQDLGATMRIIAIPYLLSQLIFIVPVYLSLPDDWRAVLLSPNSQLAFAQVSPWLTMGLVVLSALVISWAAVSWHRYVLRNESNTPGAAALQNGRVLGYFGRTILIAFLIALSILLVMLLFFVLGFAKLLPPAMAPRPDKWGVALLYSISIAFVVTYLITRLSLILPARALDEPLSLSQSWVETSHARGDIFGFATILVLLQNLSPLLPLTGLAGFVVVNLVGVIIVAIGIAMLTSLYGHLIEGRGLD